MKLSEVLINYRTRMGISQRQLSRQCGLSNSYISFIENEMNPKTGKPIKPTMDQYKNLATGMGMTVQQLWDILDDDSPVHFSETGTTYDYLSEEEHKLIDAFRAADNRAREDAVKMLLDHPRKKEKSSAI
jgi:transcriptional regulator with XRE-family HTH domain